MREEDQNSEFTEPAASFLFFLSVLTNLDSRQPQTQKREPGTDKECSRPIPPVLAGEVVKEILYTMNMRQKSFLIFLKKSFSFILLFQTPGLWKEIFQDGEEIAFDVN